MCKSRSFLAVGMVSALAVAMAIVVRLQYSSVVFITTSPAAPSMSRKRSWDIGAVDERASNHSNKAVAPLVQGTSIAELQKHSSKENVTGRVNYDIWKHAVGYTIDDLRIKDEFPNQPDERRTSDVLRTKFNQLSVSGFGGKYGHKMYGYLHPPHQGKYAFRLIFHGAMKAKCSAELWLSVDTNPFNIRRILRIDPPENKNRKFSLRNQVVTTTEEHATSLTSETLYYFEFLMQAFNGEVDVEVQWKLLNSWREFETIPSSCLSMAVYWSGKANRSVVDILEDPQLPSNKLQEYHHIKFVGDTIYTISDLNVLPWCQFKAEYVSEHRVKQYKGVKEIFKSKIYPYMASSGNPRIGEKVVAKVLRLYKEAFNQNKQLSGNVLGVHYMDETENKGKGSRFLLELDVKLDGQEQTIHTSEYVYLPNGTNDLCHTENFQWQRNVDVYLIVSLRNLWVWVKHLIHNMERIYAVTKDDHFHLIVVDYNSMDIDVEEAFKNSSFKRWTVIKINKEFSRSSGLQIGVDNVKDPDSIAMTIDMHLTLPPGFIEFARRHCVQGKMGYAPMFFRLMQGLTELQKTSTGTAGFWEKVTYGIFAMYKSDWIATGGFDTGKYTTNWGGEDWALLDSTLSKGVEVFRIGYPGFVHHYHTRVGMWGIPPPQFR